MRLLRAEHTSTESTNNLENIIISANSIARVVFLIDGTEYYLVNLNKGLFDSEVYEYTPIGRPIHFYDTIETKLNSLGAEIEKPNLLRMSLTNSKRKEFENWFREKNTDEREVGIFNPLRTLLVDATHILDNLTEGDFTADDVGLYIPEIAQSFKKIDSVPTIRYFEIYNVKFSEKIEDLLINKSKKPKIPLALLTREEIISGFIKHKDSRIKLGKEMGVNQNCCALTNIDRLRVPLYSSGGHRDALGRVWSTGELTLKEYNVHKKEPMQNALAVDKDNPCHIVVITDGISNEGRVYIQVPNSITMDDGLGRIITTLNIYNQDYSESIKLSASKEPKIKIHEKGMVNLQGLYAGLVSALAGTAGITFHLHERLLGGELFHKIGLSDDAGLYLSLLAAGVGASVLTIFGSDGVHKYLSEKVSLLWRYNHKEDIKIGKYGVGTFKHRWDTSARDMIHAENAVKRWDKERKHLVVERANILKFEYKYDIDEYKLKKHMVKNNIDPDEFCNFQFKFALPIEPIIYAHRGGGSFVPYGLPPNRIYIHTFDSNNQGRDAEVFFNRDGIIGIKYLANVKS